MQNISQDESNPEPVTQAGRPRLNPSQDCAMDNYNARITSWHARAARKIGGGNLSAGIRLAIETAFSLMNEIK